MKKLSFILNCLKNAIKKKIFNIAKTDISHDCEKLFLNDENQISPEEIQYAEEYVDNYKSTTRWQTL